MKNRLLQCHQNEWMEPILNVRPDSQITDYQNTTTPIPKPRDVSIKHLKHTNLTALVKHHKQSCR